MIFTDRTITIKDNEATIDYTFQIRLYDEEKTSRITTPEIVGGITIKEPLAAN